MKKQEQLIEDAFSIFNGGKGLDHWSYSSTSTPFAKNLIGYTFPQEVRRTFAFRYKVSDMFILTLRSVPRSADFIVWVNH